MKEAAENKADLQRKAEEHTEGKGSQSPNVISVASNPKPPGTSQEGKVTNQRCFIKPVTALGT